MTEKTLNKISAKIIADSINEHGQRLTTFVLVFPRIVLAEFNTHRMLSRNSASSRAIPFNKMLRMVQDEPFIPIKWMKEHKGMQGTEYFTDEAEIIDIHDHYLEARDFAVRKAKALNDRGVTKQVCNRLLEPYMWHTVIATGTEWQNFFALRAHDAAEIHIQELAYKMLEAYNSNRPHKLMAGEWHIPFGDNITLPPTIPIEEGMTLEEGVEFQKVKVATARCARVSYLNFEGKDDYDADLKLHDQLLKAGHMSPFEHCALAMDEEDFDLWTNGRLHVIDGPLGPHKVNDGYTEGWCGNFRGFIQYRKLIHDENKTDRRVIIK